MLLIELTGDIFLKFIKFGIVGASGILIDLAVTYIFLEKGKFQKYIANSLGFIAATISNYLLNQAWTFNSHEGAQLYQFGKFFIIAVVGLAISNLIIFVLNDNLKLNFYRSKIFAIAVVALWNFFANYLYTFTN